MKISQIINEELRNLHYSLNIIGIIRGILEMLTNLICEQAGKRLRRNSRHEWEKYKNKT
jgi:hypothetical protein